MSFWGTKIAPGATATIESELGDLLHLSQACLAPDTPAGAGAKILVEQNGTSYAVAVLKEGGQDCCALDLFVDAKDTKLKVVGKATVHLTGYFEADGMDEDDDDDEEEEEEAAPKAKAVKAAPVRAKSSPKAEVKSSPKAEVKSSPKVAATAAAAADEEDDDEDEEEEEEEG
eukprot:CAMPEP_0183560730 /NCGR_PEP_ID=MMETSP0371-20130417/95659_1 /TAXON_ID=268820 /ORGANISM="Peridinium aciculiferum, Strain PAER-2" /LENGTH=171 /DNA_ID=CAMNT_0025769033 /DNA_START=45 /DNA_END=557 /DNA_ORIENTATION=+